MGRNSIISKFLILNFLIISCSFEKNNNLALGTAICSGNPFVAVGDEGTILNSIDGTNWNTCVSNILVRLNSVTVGKNIFVATGYSGNILNSKDGGKSWKTVRGEISPKYPTAPSNIYERLFSITYGNEMFVTVGSNGKILTSSDGDSWTLRSSGTTDWLYNIIYANNIFVTVGYGGKMLTSADGMNWTSRNSGTLDHLVGITYGNELFVSVGYNGTIISSNDAIEWDNKSSETTENLRGISYGENKFVAVGDSGKIISSSDNGENWTIRKSSVTTTYQRKYENRLYGIVFMNKTFVAWGRYGNIFTSNYGITWTNNSSGDSHIYGLTYNELVL